MVITGQFQAGSLIMNMDAMIQYGVTVPHARKPSGCGLKIATGI